MRRPRLQTQTTTPGRPPSRLREVRPDIGGEPRVALRGPPLREDPPRWPHRTHRHRMAVVPADPQAGRTGTATRIDPVAGPDRRAPHRLRPHRPPPTRRTRTRARST